MSAVVRRLSVGNRVRLFFGSEVWEGPVESVTADGWLRVRLLPGWLHTVKPGDVYRVLDIVMTAEEGETWRMRHWSADRTTCTTVYRPSKIEADAEAERSIGGTTCVDRIAVQRIGKPAAPSMPVAYELDGKHFATVSRAAIAKATGAAS